MIIADTSDWLALASYHDQYHQLVLDKSTTLNDELITAWPVLAETCHLLLARLGGGVEVKFVQQVTQFSEISKILMFTCGKIGIYFKIYYS